MRIILETLIHFFGMLILSIVYRKEKNKITTIPYRITYCIVNLLSCLTYFWIFSMIALFFVENILLPLLMVAGYPTAITIWAIIVRKRQREKEKIRSLLSANKEQDAQEAATETRTTPFAEDRVDIPAEIRRYKKLLDTGVMTQEEYSAKKKQLLELPDKKQPGISPKRKEKYLMCPDCGRTQLSSRTDCWNCGRVLEKPDYK